MAFTNNQSDPKLPGDGKNKRKSQEFLPKIFRTPENTKFLGSTVDQLIQPGVVNKLNTFVGRTTAKAYEINDTYLSDVSKEREDYQLEPASIIKDDLNNITFYNDYNDYINQIKAFGSDIRDHSILNSQDYYAWNPNIDWDKIANFREYYWLPNGPEAIDVYGQTIDVESTYTVRIGDNIDNNTYVFSPDGLTQNPTITLYRGITYKFDIDTPNLPFTIKTKKTLEEGFELDSTSILVLEGVSLQGLENGISTVRLSTDTPDVLYYMAANDLQASGTIVVKDVEQATFIDVEKEIIGKKSYKTSTGTFLSNGMKVKFQGEVVPESYAVGSFYVEGVGDAIKLIPEKKLNVPTDYTDDFFVEFDNEGFDNLPFSQAFGYPTEKDYIVVNRSSIDGNLWSRYNRWFHRSVVEQSAAANGVTPDLDQSARARRPIIEFDANIKLNNFGTFAKDDVDLVDDFTTDVFSKIEGSIGYNVDGVDLTEGMRVLFTADTDILVAGKIYKVTFINFANNQSTNRQIHLVEVEDSAPQINEVVLSSQGETYGGKLLYYSTEGWKLCQEKIDVNQPPLFDVFDSDGTSYSDKFEYPASSFIGTKLFSYEQGSGPVDSELGFSLQYKSIQNVGDIVFKFDLLQDSFTYTIDNDVLTKNTDIGFLRKYSSRTAYNDINGWQKADTKTTQKVIRQYIFDNTFTNLSVDVYDNSADLSDLKIIVLKNNDLQFLDTDYTLGVDNQNFVTVNFVNDLNLGDNIIVKTESSAPKNANGYYEIPSAIERNPLNEKLSVFTLGEINDHVGTIVESVDDFSGKYPGVSNLRDLGPISKFGKRFVQHDATMNLPLYHLIDNDSNILKAIDYSKKEYNKFKREFLQTAESLGYTGTVREHVDKVLENVNFSKSENSSFYFTDMIASGAFVKSRSKIVDQDETFFPLSKIFTLNNLSTHAVSVYLNDKILTHKVDYTFNNEGYVLITADKNPGDFIEIYEYETTNASYIPATPTKLGLYPSFVPKIYIDNTYVEPVKIIQGHDGSKFIAFNDYRDDLLLELELRIFNNLKKDYNDNFFDIHSFIGGAFRNTNITKDQLDKIVLPSFIAWSRLVDQDYTRNNTFDRTNPFTFNYSKSIDIQGNFLPGYWREIFKKFYDTDRPHTNPWEMLGFTIQPEWWNDEYGPAPYTSNNLILWEDLQNGIVKIPGQKAIIINKYKRPGLLNFIPVDSSGNLKNPLEAGLVKYFDASSIDESWIFGDGGPVEAAWRNSSDYRFSLIKSFICNKPAETFAYGFDRENQIKNLAGQNVYKATNQRLRLKDIVLPRSFENPDNATSGLINYVYDYMSSDVTLNYETYKDNLKLIGNQLGFKLAGFTDKDKFKLVLDSRTPLNEGNVFVPDENYDIFLNRSTPIKLLAYSGVIVERRTDGYVVKGYDNQNTIFNTYNIIERQNDTSINIGGISEPFFEWQENRRYVAGQNVEYEGSYYRVKKDFVSQESFDLDNLVKLPNLPLIGGRDAFLRRNFDKKSTVEIQYGTLFKEIQDVVDFLLGYGEWLKDQGVVFDYYEQDATAVLNWEHSVREFLFWTTQNWGEGSVITLSPSAKQFKLNSQYSVVDSLVSGPFEYSILKADGNKLDRDFVGFGRDANEFILRPKNTEDGIYFIRLPLIQVEHVVIIDNDTVFGDTIYDLAPGYRQERIKVLGYRTDDWNGSFNIPGFVYDDAKVTDWEQYKDYAIGDVVKYKEFYYSAKIKVPGSQFFESNNWVRLDKKPERGLLPNFDYRVNQFADYYDLDSDNFDLEQQKVAQHLFGYQKRKYLENIIQDDVSQYKFYQGMIQEKGTLNSLSKMFDALASDEKDSLEFFEEWAVKDGQYGAADGFDEFEIALDELSFRLTPQPILLTNNITGNETDLIYRIPDYKILQKNKEAETYLPTKRVIDSYVDNAGYVNQQDVRGIAKSYQDILEFQFSQIKQGDYLWIGDYNGSWSVLKHVRSDNTIESITRTETGFIVTTEKNIKDVAVEDIIGIYSVNSYAPTGEDSTSIVGQNTTTNYDLDSFYKVTEVSKNTITVETNNIPEDDILDCIGSISIFVPVRASDVSIANAIAQKVLEDNDLFWIDSTDEQNSWKVLRNDNLFSINQTITNNNKQDVGYSKSIAVDDRNTTLIVGAPDNENGKVYVYTRPTDSLSFVLNQILEPFTFADDGEKFGKSISISPDGQYIAVGSPEASNVKSKFFGNWVSTNDYGKNSIVVKDQQLWRAIVDIQGQEAAIQTPSFGSISQSYEELGLDDAILEVNTLLVGNYAINNITGLYAFANEPVDHILVKVPKLIYEGSGEGFSTRLNFNDITDSNVNLPYGTIKLPFDNSFSVLDETFFDSTHTIDKKVDEILYVNSSTNQPQIGDILETQTASGEVTYIHQDGAEIVIYLKNTNGIFNNEDSLFRNDGDFIGQAIKQNIDPLDTSDVFGGYWFIQTPQYTPTANTVNQEKGLGLVIADLANPSDLEAPFVDTNTYYNSLDYNNELVSSENTKNSYIRKLSTQGLPGAGGTFDPILSRLYVLRGPKELTDSLGAGDPLSIWINQFTKPELGIVPDLTNIGLSKQETNKAHSVYDIWDGYIQIDHIGLDGAGNPFEPLPGQIVRDNITGATAEVTYFQRDGLVSTIFVKNVTGTWSVGDDYGQNTELFMLAIPGSIDSIYGFDQNVGQVQFVSLGLEEAGIGGLIVLEASDLIELTDQEIIENVEYYMYREENINGIPRPANAPSITNNEWETVYKINADITGQASGLTNEGLYYIYNRVRTGSYDLINAFTVPEKSENLRLGNNLFFTKTADLYKLYVQAGGNKESVNPGRIYFVNKGEENQVNYDWDFAKDKRFRGAFSENVNYSTGDIIYLDIDKGSLYQAKTNLAPGVFNINDWTSTNDLVSYIGYIPNTTSFLVLNDSSQFTGVLEDQNLIDFGSRFDVSKNGLVLIATAEYTNSDPNKIVVYRYNRGHFEFSQEIIAEDNTSQFGDSISISDNGRFIAIGNPYNDDKQENQGQVKVYQQIDGTFVEVQTLNSKNNERAEEFGKIVQFDGEQLHVVARNSDSETGTTIDNGETTFDNNFTTLQSDRQDQGLVYVYSLVDNRFLLAQSVSTSDTDLPNFGDNIFAKNNHLYVGSTNGENNVGEKGQIFDYKLENKNSMYTVYRQIKPTVDIDKIKSVFLYNRSKGELVTYLDYVDPIQGKLAGPAEQNLTYKTYFDPANYTIGEEVSVDTTAAWTDEHVGEVWWNLTNAKFINPYQDNVIYSTQNWNKVFQGNTIDVYEWIESDLLPSERDAIADTEEGIGRGISGQSLYGNTSYSVKEVFDSVGQSFSNKYYFWVKDSKIIPNVDFRTLSLTDITTYITDPSSINHKYVSLISPDQFTIHNIEELLNDDDIVLSVQYYTIENQTINTHNQYQLISENLETSQPKNDIINKWFDSLIGYDDQNRLVPDPSVPAKYRYGTLNSPRQSWFVNKTEALKQFIERVNSVLLQNIIVESRDITDLNQYDTEPTVASALYDLTVDNFSDLEFVGVARAERAVLTPIVENGKIINLEIVNPGRGYRSAPKVTILGSGSNAEISLTIDSIGKVVGFSIDNAGENYDQSTIVQVRRFSVLVLNDPSIQNRWAIYERISENKTWNRIRSQNFDTRLYWNYVDWYAQGYSKNTNINYTIDNSYELSSLNVGLGEIVKINNVGTGGWLLLEKENLDITADLTLNYKTIGRQDGTIQFSSNLYDSNAASVGFDTISFDIKIFDNEPVAELRIILDTIKNKIFVSDLQKEFNSLFFSSLRYVLSEQESVDWMFKTSFIKVKHNVGSLREDLTFNNDNLPSYEDYVKEVKPFRTKIREYLSAYEKVESTNSLISDFDLAPFYRNFEGSILPYTVRIVDNQLVTEENLSEYPARSWLDNYKSQIVSASVVDGGSGYTVTPKITLTGGGGTGAELRVFLGSGGSITRVDVVNPGTGYVSAPQIEILGNLEDNGRPARLSLELGGSPVRSISTGIKFDRIYGRYNITKLASTESFVGTGNKFEFDLKWPIELDKSKVEVTVNGILSLESEYIYYNKDDTTLGYTRQIGVLEFVNAPAEGINISISYEKAASLLTAEDRIGAYYSPTVGMLGKDLAQLMSGVDYGGVQITSFAFAAEQGWDSDTWYDGTWDSFDPIYDDEIIDIDEEIFEFDGSTTIVNTTKPLIKGKLYSVYLNDNRLDDPNYDGSTVLENQNAIMEPLIGDGTTTSFDLLDFKSPAYRQDGHNTGILLEIQPGDKLVIKKLEDGDPNLIKLSKPLQDGVVYNVYLNGKRLDDPNYDGSTILDNTNAIMEPLLGDGTTSELDIRNFKMPAYREDGRNDGANLNLETGDRFIIRRSTSDGTFLPSEDSYDTVLTGGPLTYQTATGLAAEDILVDGNDFINPLTSQGPEEQVPGHVLDTLDIKVYERPKAGTSNITSLNYSGDGVTKTFDIGTKPITQESLFVKLGTVLQDTNLFTIDFENDTITFNTAPTFGEKVNITTVDVSGTNIIDTDQIIADGSTVNFLTNVRYSDNLQSIVTVNGSRQPYVILESDNTYVVSGNAVISLAEPPGEDSVIKYVFFEGESQEFSEVTVDNFTGDGSTSVYKLSQAPFDKSPGHYYTIVKVGNKVLNPGYSERFTLSSNNREYFVNDAQIEEGTLSSQEIRVYINETEIEYLSEWTWISDRNLIRLKPGVEIQDGDILDLYLISNGEYRFGFFDQADVFNEVPDTLYLDETPVDNQDIKVYQFSNHDAQGFQRDTTTVISRQNLTGQNYITEGIRSNGLIALREEAIDAQYVWVSINGELLNPSIEYYVTENKRYIKIIKEVAPGDVIDILHFAKAATINKFGWRQFKDMLNRTHYKRLDDTNEVYLERDLNQYDNVIHVTNGELLANPDAESRVPGIIFIDKERIEFFVRDGNKLSQLRRGTLGTGVKDVHVAGSRVNDQGNSQNMPYNDQTLISSFIADGTTNTVTLDFIPESPNLYGDAIDTIEVFVAGRRLRKNSISSYRFETTENETIIEPLAQDSPQGDITLDAEFTLEGNVLTFTDTPSENVQIQVIRKVGNTWSDPGTPLGQADNAISRFLRSVTVDLPR